MKTLQVCTVASVEDHDGDAPELCARSIILAGGREVPHHRAGDANPDRDPPPVMAAWIHGANGVGDVYSAVSTDGGRSWSAPRLIAASNDRETYVDVTLFSEGELSFAYLGATPANAAADRGIATLRCFTTGDLGLNWESRDLSVSLDSGLMTGGRLMSYCGHYLLPVHTVGQGSIQTALLSDDLLAWAPGGAVPRPEHLDLNDGHITHTQPEEHGDGLIMVMRDGEDRSGHAHYSISEDCGESWSPATEFPEVPSHSSRGFFATDSLGRYVAVFHPSGGKRELKCRVKEPRGPWGPVHEFPSPGDVNDNVDAVEVAAGRFYAVLDSDRTSIVFADVEF